MLDFISCNPSRVKTCLSFYREMIPHLYCLICMKPFCMEKKSPGESSYDLLCENGREKITQFYMKTQRLDIRKWFVFLKFMKGCKVLLDRLMDLLCAVSPKQAS